MDGMRFSSQGAAPADMLADAVFATLTRVFHDDDMRGRLREARSVEERTHGRLDFTDDDAKVDMDDWEAKAHGLFGTVWCDVS